MKRWLVCAGDRSAMAVAIVLAATVVIGQDVQDPPSPPPDFETRVQVKGKVALFIIPSEEYNVFSRAFGITAERRREEVTALNATLTQIRPQLQKVGVEMRVGNPAIFERVHSDGTPQRCHVGPIFAGVIFWTDRKRPQLHAGAPTAERLMTAAKEYFSVSP